MMQKIIIIITLYTFFKMFCLLAADCWRPSKKKNKRMGSRQWKSLARIGHVRLNLVFVTGKENVKGQFTPVSPATDLIGR